MQEDPNRTTTRQKNNVSCRNINIIVKYVNKKIGRDILLTSNLPYPKEYLLNEHNWIPLDTYNEIMNRAITLLHDPNAPHKIGRSAMELESWGIFSHIRKIFLTIFINPSMVYRKVSDYNPLFNNTKDFHLLYTNNKNCLFKVVFHNDINPIDDYHSDNYIQGLLSSIPQIWELPDSRITRISNEYNVIELLSRLGNIDKKDIVLTEKELLVKNKLLGKIINNETFTENLFFENFKKIHTIEDEELFEELKKETEKISNGILILEDFTANNLITLKRGEIYNAPHFTYHITWTKPPLKKLLRFLLINKWKSYRTYENAIVDSLATIQGYTETLEQKVIERTKELEMARKDSEFWRNKADQLLSTMLPKNIAQQMIENKLESKEIYGTVIYTDIVDFTKYNKETNQSVVDQELKKYFSEITNTVTQEGGWVNKFLGDGMLIVFGLNEESTPTHNALEVAKKIITITDNYSWGTRISITTGNFTIGEYGNEGLRRFDCVGHTLNLGSRLQSFANKNEIIVCETSYKKLKESTEHTFNEKKGLDIKGVGLTNAYTLIL